jgi:branched-chain amino acid transport system ATP-binding protein
MSALQVDNLFKNYAGVQALKGIRFEVAAGECVALIGPNGAGKSTCFACLAGQQWPTQGHVRWHGESLDGLTATQRLQRGVARTFQVAQTFDALTVLQNIQLVWRGSNSALAQTHRAGLRRLDQVAKLPAAGLADSVGLKNSAHLLAGQLPYGAKKRLELAMALAGLPPHQPGLLLLDEPAAGLGAQERGAMMALVRSVMASFTQQVTVLYTEHNMDAVFGVADRVLVLIDGELAAQGTPESIAQNALVRQRYLGQHFQVPPFAGVHHA